MQAETASRDKGDAEQTEVLERNALTADLLWPISFREAYRRIAAPIVCGDLFEYLGLLPVSIETRDAAIRIGFPSGESQELHNVLRVWMRQRPKENGVDKGKDRGICAYG